MAYDENLAGRIRGAVVGRDGVSEQKMFGGVAFMVGGHMFCGIVKDDLMVRVGPEAHDAALSQPGVRLMDFAGRPMRGMIYVGPEAVKADEDLTRWVDAGFGFASGLPAKKAKKKRAKTVRL